MTFIQEELAILRGQKDGAFDYKKLCKRVLDEASVYLKSFQPQFEKLSREQNEANDRFQRYNAEANDARRSKNRFLADDAAWKARSAKSDIQSIKSRRQQLIEKQRSAKTSFQVALEDYRKAKAECDRLVEEYNKLQTQLKGQYGEEWQSHHSGSRPEGEGAQWSQGGITYTVNSTDDPKAPGGYYLSMRDEQTGDHTTAVYNPDDTFAETKANKQWKPAPKQE